MLTWNSLAYAGEPNRYRESFESVALTTRPNCPGENDVVSASFQAQNLD